MQIINCFIQVFMGAVSGYYTNKLAISHLFTDIPLPGGSWRAVIKKGGNKERLAQDLAEIAEDKILGEHTERGEASYLSQELSKESVFNALDECVRSVFTELEKSEAAKQNVSDILQEYFSKEPGNKILKQAVQTAVADSKIGDFLSEETFVSFCEDVWNHDLLPAISAEKEDILEKVFLELSREEEPVTIERIFGKNFCDQTETIFVKKAMDILAKMNQNSERLKLEGYLHAICRQLGTGSIVRNVLLGLKEKTIGEILDSDVLAEISFSKEIKILLEQPRIYNQLKDFFEGIKKELEALELTVADLLPEGCLENEAVTEMLSVQIKKQQSFVSDLYEDNREFISERLREELSNVIDEGTGNFLQNMVLLGAKDIIIEKMEQFLEKNVPEKLQHFLEKPSEETCQKLCHMLGELPVKGVLEKITFEMVFAFLEKELLSEESRKKTDSYIAEKIRGISLGSVFNDDIVDFVSKKADSLFPDMISEWLKGEEKERQVKNIVHVLFEKICRMPPGKQGAKTLAEFVSRLLPMDQGFPKATKGTNVFSTMYRKFSGIYIKDLSKKIFKSFSETKEYSKGVFKEPNEEYPKGVSKALDEEYPKGVSKAPDEEYLKEVSKEPNKEYPEGVSKERSEGRKEKTITVGDIISMIPVEEVQKKVRGLFAEKAAGYLQIKPVVEEKVLALDDDMLGSMMQKFMGTQLRPLNVIGGVLGAVVGFFLFLLFPAEKMTAVSVLVTMLCYALIGIGTNVLALHGLFRPYHMEERWLGRVVKKGGFLSKAGMGCYHLAEKIPGVRMIFCLGYIPEKKNTIAKQLADFVAVNFLHPEDLLPKIKVNTEMVQNFVKEQGETVADKAVDSLKQSDWEPVIKNAALSFLGNNASGLIEKADFSFLEEPVYAMLEKEMEKPVSSYMAVETAAEKMSGYLQSQVIRMCSEPDNIMKKIQEAGKSSEKETGGAERKTGFWKEKKVSEYLPKQKTEYLERMAEKASSFLLGENFCHSAQQWLVRIWNKKAQQKNRTVSSFFDGKAGNFLEKNLDGLETFLLNTIKTEVYRYLLAHEDELVEKIDQEVQEMMNHMADGMAIGGMASSMLGTRQIIEKVFHRTFLEPSYSSWEGETEEIVVKERLSDELLERNEDRLREKLGEIFGAMSFITSGDLEQLLFPQEDYRIVDNTDENRAGVWINHLCQIVLEALKHTKEQGRRTLFALAELAAEKAGEHSIGDYVRYMDSAFIKNESGKVLDGVVKAVKKPSMEQEMTEFFVYFFNSYIWNDSAGSFFAFSKDSAAVAVRNSAALLRRQESVRETMETWLLPVEKRLSQETVLWKELSGKLKKTECIYDGAGELILGIASSIPQQTQGSVYVLMEELAGCMNRAFQYEGEENAGLVSVAEKIDFSRIIYLAVMDMGDRQIEELFKGFAGQYFFSLKLSGALGFVFGIPVVQWIVAAAALGTEFFGKNIPERKERK